MIAKKNFCIGYRPGPIILMHYLIRNHLSINSYYGIYALFFVEINI